MLRPPSGLWPLVEKHYYKHIGIPFLLLLFCQIKRIYIVNNDQIFHYWVNYSFKKHSMSHSSQIFSLCPSLPLFRFAYTVAAVLLSTLVRRLRLHRVEGQVVEARYELVTTPKDDTWITVSKRN